MANLWFSALLCLAQASAPATAAARCGIQLSSMDSHSSLAGSLEASIRKQVADSATLLWDGTSSYDVDIRIVRTKLVNVADRMLPPSTTPPDFVAFYALLSRDETFLSGGIVTCKGGSGNCARSVLIHVDQVCGARPNSSFKPTPLRGAA